MWREGMQVLGRCHSKISLFWEYGVFDCSCRVGRLDIRHLRKMQDKGDLTNLGVEGSFET